LRLWGDVMAMTNEEIIQTADDLYPNGFTPASKLTQIYVLDQKLLRTIYRIKTAYAYDIVAGQYLYPLPFSTSKIISVVWDGVTVDYEDINEDNETPPFLYTYQGSIGRYPTPDTDVPGGLIVIAYVEPVKGDEEAYPSFDGDFPMVHVYNLCQWMAARNREYDISSGFIRQYNSELEEFKKANPEPALPPMRVE
jgi:hypothetical protein